MHVIPALVRQRQEDHIFKVSLSYTDSPCLRKGREYEIWICITPSMDLRDQYAAESAAEGHILYGREHL